MGSIRLPYEELIVIRLLDLNPLQPHYYSNLLNLANQMLSPPERDELRQLIFEVEKMVLETEILSKEDENGELIWVERIKGELSLYDIEMAIESNPDYYAFFRREDGKVISKFDIERKLDQIKSWIYAKVMVRAQNRRFSKFR